jgi:dethiobiotin synthetase
MSKGLFVTGTGTDIGKTYVTGLIVKKLRSSGLDAGYYKPALSGAKLINGELVPGDCKHVADTAGLQIAPTKLASYIYKTEVSPHLAAQIECRQIEPDVIFNDFEKFMHKYSYITVEGCGGIICPLRLDSNILMQTDIIKLLNLDVLIVAESGLGSINSAALTVHYAESHGINIRGIILNNYDATNFLHRDNKNSIELITKISVVACVPAGATSLDMDTPDLCRLYKEL